MKYLSSLKNKNLSKQICLLRVDFNIEDAELSEKNLRIKSILPTIRFLINKGTKVVILSHRGRPATLKRVISKKISLRPFATILSKLLKKSVQFTDFKKDFETIKTIIKNAPTGNVFLLENLRFLPGEDKNDANLAKRLAGLGTFYVNDAFAFSHRKDASMVAITKFLPSYAGLLLEREIRNLSQVMKNPKKPLIVILGGIKISDKIGLIKNFSKKADKVLIGGGLANTFFAAQKLPVDNSLYEKQMIPLAKQLLKSKKIVLPIDSITKKGKILDIGQKARSLYAQIIKNAKTIIWNGPMGYIEDKQFRKGSEVILEAILKNHAFSIIGGGETTSLLKTESNKLKANIFVSTGGGAMLEYLADKKLPGIVALQRNIKKL